MSNAQAASVSPVPDLDPALSAVGVAPVARQLILLDGGEGPDWSLSPRTRAIGKRGIAEARAALARSSRAERRTHRDDPLADLAGFAASSERKAG
jgi:hypothetical protein